MSSTTTTTDKAPRLPPLENHHSDISLGMLPSYLERVEGLVQWTDKIADFEDGRNKDVDSLKKELEDAVGLHAAHSRIDRVCEELDGVRKTVDYARLHARTASPETPAVPVDQPVIQITAGPWTPAVPVDQREIQITTGRWTPNGFISDPVVKTRSPDKKKVGEEREKKEAYRRRAAEEEAEKEANLQRLRELEAKREKREKEEAEERLTAKTTVEDLLSQIKRLSRDDLTRLLTSLMGHAF